MRSEPEQSSRCVRTAMLRCAALASLAAVAFVACSDADTTHDPSLGVDAKAFDASGGLFDGVFQNDLQLGTKDGSPDTGAALDAEPGTCEFATDPMPGQPGAPCTAAGDCDNNLCVNDSEGGICTRQCVSCCPNGYQCQQNLVGSDTYFVCLPQLLALCYPCKADSECEGLNAGALCLDYGEAGRFCGGPCAVDSDCPTDYACEQAMGSQGTANQCVRKTGGCGCSPKAQAAGAETTCQITNLAGTCSGTRTCGGEGMGPCTASVPAPEKCNAKDDDCDGATDEGTSDYDKDGTADCIDDDMDGDLSKNEKDCEPLDETIHPDADEKCNGKDDDCDGVTDQGFPDTDGDGMADCVDLDDDGDGVLDPNDCAPLDKAISPKAVEACNGVDDDCDGKTDEGFGDKDFDGKADCIDGDKDGDGSPDEEDCKPLDKTVYPGAPEACNGKDDDCDGKTDGQDSKGCKFFHKDADQDGIGAEAVQCLCAPAGQYTAVNGGDCDDNDPKVGPGGQEICGNGQDDDCDGKVDEPDGKIGCTSFYVDADADGFGAGKAVCLCQATGNTTATKAGDCNDADLQINPNATEVCGGGDENCNGKSDEAGAQACTLFYTDADKDGYGSTDKNACMCKPDLVFTTATGGDCQDVDVAVNPGAKESCNGKDDNCNAATDEQDAIGCKPYWVDQDGDGFGGPASACLCVLKAPYAVSQGGDCDDLKKVTYPKAKEICDSADNDCDNLVDEGYSLGGNCSAGSGGCVVQGSYVCKADGSGVECGAKPGQGKVEACNGQDDDCNGATDEGCDDDGDGYCDATKGYTGSPACGKGGNDCNDLNPGIHPGAVESCNNADDDCNGQVDGGKQACSTACGSGTETCTSGNWGGCTAQKPACTSGACCDGCNFKASTTQCGASAYSSKTVCTALSCGGDVKLQEQWQYCTGSSSSCGTSNLKWLDKGVTQNCASNALCTQSGTSASCKVCGNGCSGSACNTQTMYTICIDPGYGGNEPGAMNSAKGLVEKNLNLSFALHLKAWLEADTANASGGGTWKVVMTRTGDSSLSVGARASICNNAGAHRVLSIFTNDYSDKSANGAETYVVPGASGTTMDFASKVQSEVVAHFGVGNRGVKQASYQILVQTDAPAALVLPGFINNASDSTKLASDASRKEAARGMLHALQKHYGYAEFTP